MFKPQKVLSLSKELEKKNPQLSGEYMITTKKDGWYVVIPYCVATGWGYPLSSNLREIPSLKWVADSLNNKRYSHNANLFLITEAIIPDVKFPELNGILNRSKGECSCKDVIFQVHDIVIPTMLELTALQRWNLLEQLTLPTAIFERVPLLEVSTYHKDLWKKRFDSEVNKGEEGIILKRANDIYQFGKRNSSLLKMKLECMVDLLAVRLEEGVGEKGNDSLTLVCKRTNGVEVRTVIGRHDDKKLFREQPEEVINKVVTIKAMEAFPDGNLRQPIFGWVRHDKEVHEID